MVHDEKVKDYGMVSIVMLSHNRAQYVEESVRSVMNQMSGISGRQISWRSRYGSWRRMGMHSLTISLGR